MKVDSATGQGGQAWRGQTGSPWAAVSAGQVGVLLEMDSVFVKCIAPNTTKPVCFSAKHDMDGLGLGLVLLGSAASVGSLLVQIIGSVGCAQL